MFEYKSEIVKNAGVAWFSDKASGEDLENLDKLLNERAKEGWELVTYSYMLTSAQLRGAFVVTFKKQKGVIE